MGFKLVNVTNNQGFELAEGRTYLVGRTLQSDIPIFDASISRRHAEIFVTQTGLTIKDLRSANGTFINGAEVTRGTLVADDSVRFGKIDFQLQSTDFAAPHASPLGGQEFQPPGRTIVRQIAFTRGVPVALVPDVPEAAGAGQLKVRATSPQDRQAWKLQLLLDVSRKLSGELDLDNLLSHIVESTFELMEVDRVSVLLSLGDSSELIPRKAKNRSGESAAVRVPRSIARTAVNDRVAIRSDNAAEDARFSGKTIEDVRSAMCVPLLVSAERVVGVLYVDNRTASGAYTDEDLDFLTGFGGVAASGIKNAQFAEQIQREAFVRANLERYFAPNVAAEIARHESAVKLGGDKRPVTVLFSDVRGFTSLSENRSPEDIAGLLTDYFREMVEIVFNNGGTLDKFVGDGLMAVWGAPIAHEDDAARAVRAAIQMQQALQLLNEEWKGADRPQVDVGIGINYGEVFAGNIGSERRLQYTVIGDAVNVASRLCDKAAPREILISDELYQVLNDKDKPPVETVSPLDVKNRKRLVPAWKLKWETLPQSPMFDS